MATAENPAAISQEDLDALQEAIDRAVKGIRDPKRCAGRARRWTKHEKRCGATTARGTLPLI